MKLELVQRDVEEIVVQSGWRIRKTKVALTGSIYLDIFRERGDEREWAVVRVADHKKVYDRWMVTYSVAPCDLWIEELGEILVKPFGEVGDIL